MLDHHEATIECSDMHEEGATAWSRGRHRRYLARPVGLIDACPSLGLESVHMGHQPTPSVRASSTGTLGVLVARHTRCSGLWSLFWPGLWPSLGLMASGNNFDRRQPRSWSSHNKTIYHLCRSHTSHITTHRPKAKRHRPEHISLRARAADRFQRRHHVKLYLSAGDAIVYHASDTAAHCDLHLPTRLPKALRQATPESDRREHTTNPSSPNSLSKNPCAAF